MWVTSLAHGLKTLSSSRGKHPQQSCDHESNALTTVSQCSTKFYA